MTTVTQPLPALAARVIIPLDVDYLILDAALQRRFYTGPNGRAEFWRGKDNCGHLYARNPRFGRGAAGLKLETDADLDLAVDLAGQCLEAINWNGIIEAETKPHVERMTLKMRVTDLNFYNPDHSQSEMAGRGFDLVKGSLIPQIETFSYDISPYVRQLTEVLNAAPASEEVTQLKSALASLRIDPEIVAEDTGVELKAELALPDSLTATPAGKSRPGPEQIAQWRAALKEAGDFIQVASARTDAFASDPQVRDQLRAVAADARNRIDRALQHPEPRLDPLPIVRDDWLHLRAIIEAAARRGALGDNALVMLSFVTVGDALFALDQQAPGIATQAIPAALGASAQRLTAPDFGRSGFQ